MRRLKKLNNEALLNALIESDIGDFSSDLEDFDPNWSELDDEESESSDEEIDDKVKKEKRNKEASKSAESEPNKVWCRRPFSPVKWTMKQPSEPSNQVPTTIESPKYYFSKYFNDEFFQQITENSNKHYLNMTGKRLDATIGEMKNFFGIVMAMGCIRYSRIRMYWQNKTKLPIIAHTMARERFYAFKMALKIVDEEKDVSEAEKRTNIFWKIQPVIDAVRKGCRSISREGEPPGAESSSYAIADQMISFSQIGAISQIGLENIIMTTPEGLVLDFEINQGINDDDGDDNDDVGAGSALIFRLIETLPKGSKICLDRYFTTIPLLRKLLSERHIYCTGTIAKKRLHGVNFKKDREMKRGEMEEFCHVENNISIVQWKDLKAITLASTAYGCQPLSRVVRHDRRKKKTIEIAIPSIVHEYHSTMRGITVSNRLMESCRAFIQATKWPFKALQYFLNLACCNAWLEYRSACRHNSKPSKDINDLLSFRLYLAEALTSIDKNNKKNGGIQEAPLESDRVIGNDDDDDGDECTEAEAKRYRYSNQPCDEKRLDGYAHWPHDDNLKAPRACRLHGCRSRTRTLCTKCNVYLCLTKNRNCFHKYHTEI